jgi:hypothetical protein
MQSPIPLVALTPPLEDIAAACSPLPTPASALIIGNTLALVASPSPRNSPRPPAPSLPPKTSTAFSPKSSSPSLKIASPPVKPPSSATSDRCSSAPTTKSSSTRRSRRKPRRRTRHASSSVATFPGAIRSTPPLRFHLLPLLLATLLLLPSPRPRLRPHKPKRLHPLHHLQPLRPRRFQTSATSIPTIRPYIHRSTPTGIPMFATSRPPPGEQHFRGGGIRRKTFR